MLIWIHSIDDVCKVSPSVLPALHCSSASSQTRSIASQPRKRKPIHHPQFPAQWSLKHFSQLTPKASYLAEKKRRKKKPKTHHQAPGPNCETENPFLVIFVYTLAVIIKRGDQVETQSRVGVYHGCMYVGIDIGKSYTD